MPMTPSGITRTVGLWILILGCIASSTIDFIGGNSIWGWFKLVVAGVVVLYELYYFLVRGKTISTKYKDFILKHPFLGWTSLFLFALALTGLVIHLCFW